MNSLDKRPWYNRDKAICMEYYDEADMVLKVNSMSGENVTRPISDNIPNYKNNKMFNLNTNTLHGNQATSPVICTLFFQQGV
jgi:hypothetical protein